ncbi:DUF86 domain-containing protein [Leeuwenhoekiella sp. A16]|uniref:HepT-like ribonuclease domain-containing protein n=1 Tax=unclassified Leeuwenhoekiella TaxID=2615029 RepID=UPI003A7FD330
MRKNDQRNSLMYLQDMHLAMRKIIQYLEGYIYESFVEDERTVDAVIRNFEIIGEASKNIPARIKSEYPELPWAEMYALRNQASHAYFNMIPKIIWEIATNNLPQNIKIVENIISVERDK